MRLLALLAAALLVAGCGARNEDAGLASLPGAIYDPPRPAAPLRLVDGDGVPFDLAAQRGNVVLVYFGFTECPDVCPETLGRWVEVHAALGADTSRVRFVFASIDPENDTPAVASAYARKFQPSFTGLSGTRAQVEETALAWGVAPASGADRTHSTQVFVVGPDGMLRWGYGRSAGVEEITRGVRAIAQTR